MKCEKCLYKDFYQRLENGYEITSRDSRATCIEIWQLDKKGEEVKWQFIHLAKKQRNKKL
jgi:hypothetical protein